MRTYSPQWRGIDNHPNLGYQKAPHRFLHMASHGKQASYSVFNKGPFSSQWMDVYNFRPGRVFLFHSLVFHCHQYL